MAHFNFLSFPLVTHISPPSSIQTMLYYIPFKRYFNPLSNEGVPMIRNHGGKVLYSEHFDFSYLILHSGHWVLMPGEDSHPIEHILLAMLTF